MRKKGKEEENNLYGDPFHKIKKKNTNSIPLELYIFRSIHTDR